MFLEVFPELQSLKRQAELGFAKENSPSGRWPNVVLNVAGADCYRDNIKGPLSIFTNISGESVVSIDKNRTVIREGFYYLTNQEQFYTLEASAKIPTETFNIHFGADFMDSLWQAVTNSAEFLLEEHFTKSQTRIEFHNRLNTRSSFLTNMVLRLKSEKEGSGLAFEEQLTAMALFLLREEKDLKKIQSRIPAAKMNTRHELFKRLSIAVDYIYSNYNADISLEELANVCCMSKFHFLRLFKTAYQKTPGEFLDELRINKAKEILRKGKSEINELARSLGYRHSSAFSRMFRNHVGVYPTQFR